MTTTPCYLAQPTVSRSLVRALHLDDGESLPSNLEFLVRGHDQHRDGRTVGRNNPSVSVSGFVAFRIDSDAEDLEPRESTCAHGGIVFAHPRCEDDRVCATKLGEVGANVAANPVHVDVEGEPRIDITRYGHAMAIPVPGNLSEIRPQGMLKKGSMLSQYEHKKLSYDRLSFAHSDWAGYSVFEEAFTLGHGAV